MVKETLIFEYVATEEQLFIRFYVVNDIVDSVVAQY
jgi:hypothetical protein